MSKGSRLVIAMFALLGAWGCLATAMSPSPGISVGWLYGLTAMCIGVALACTNSPIGVIARRIMCGCVALAYVAYLVKEIVAPDAGLFNNARANPSLINALKGLAYIGMPCAFYAWQGSGSIDWLKKKLAPKQDGEEAKPPLAAATETDQPTY